MPGTIPETNKTLTTDKVMVIPVLPEKNLPLSMLSPTVTNVVLYNSKTRLPGSKAGNQTPPRLVYEYELQIFTKTGGVAIIDGSEYPISHGDIRFHRPGQIVSTILDYECYSCRFKFENSFLELNTKHTSEDISRNSSGHILGIEKFQPLYKSPYLDCIPPFLSASSPNDYYSIYEIMLDAYINPDERSPLLLKAKMIELLSLLYIDSRRSQSSGHVDRHAADAVAGAMAFIRENFAHSLTLSIISNAVNLSPTYFHRIFTNTVTMTPLQYLTKVRIKRARTLLVTTLLPISEIALQCGFESTSYFSAVFRKNTGYTPVAFRKHKQLENYKNM